MTTPQPAALPELPEPDYWSTRDDDTPLYTADQMDARYLRGYNDALAALQSQPAAAGVSDAGAPFWMLRTTCPYCEQGFAFDRPEVDASDELVDQHLDAILSAAGSALRHYTMQKSKDDMRSALRRAILALRPQSYPLPDDLYDSKDWRQGNYASRVEWLHTMYEHAKQERDEYAAQLEALRPQAVPTLDLEAACIGYARLDGNEYKLVSMRRNPVMDDGQLHPIYTFSDEVAEAHHGITAQGAQGEPK